MAEQSTEKQVFANTNGNRQEETDVRSSHDKNSDITNDRAAGFTKNEMESIAAEDHDVIEINCESNKSIDFEQINKKESRVEIASRVDNQTDTKFKKTNDQTQNAFSRTNDEREVKIGTTNDQREVKIGTTDCQTEIELVSTNNHNERSVGGTNDQSQNEVSEQKDQVNFALNRTTNQIKLDGATDQLETIIDRANELIRTNQEKTYDLKETKVDGTCTKDQTNIKLGDTNNQIESKLSCTKDKREDKTERTKDKTKSVHLTNDKIIIIKSVSENESANKDEHKHECLDPRCPKKIDSDIIVKCTHFEKYRPKFTSLHREPPDTLLSHCRRWSPQCSHSNISSNLSDLNEALDLSIPKSHASDRPLVLTMEKTLNSNSKMYHMDFKQMSKPTNVDKRPIKQTKRRHVPGGDIKNMQDLYKGTMDVPTNLSTPRPENLFPPPLMSRNIPLQPGANSRPDYQYSSIVIGNMSKLNEPLMPTVPKLLHRPIEPLSFRHKTPGIQPNNTASVVPAQPIVVYVVPGSLTMPVKTRTDLVKIAPRLPMNQTIQPIKSCNPAVQPANTLWKDSTYQYSKNQPVQQVMNQQNHSSLTNSSLAKPELGSIQPNTYTIMPPPLKPVEPVSSQTVVGTVSATTDTSGLNPTPSTEKWIGTPQVNWEGRDLFKSMRLAQQNENKPKPIIRGHVIKGQGKQISTYLICNTCMSFGKAMAPFVNGFTMANHVCKFHHIMRNITGPQFHFTMHTELVNYHCIPVLQEKIFPCKYGNCLGKFTSIKLLKDHIVECHAKDIKVYLFQKCQYRNCERIFPTHKLRKQHVKEFHLEHRIQAEDTYGALWLVKTTQNKEIHTENKDKLERNHEEAFKEMRNFFSRSYILQRFQVTSVEHFTSFCESCDYEERKEETFDKDKYETLESFEKEISVSNLCKEVKSSGGDFVIDINNVKSRMLDGGIIIHNEETGCCVYIDDVNKGDNPQMQKQDDLDDIIPLSSPLAAETDNNLPDKDIVDNIKPKDVEMDVGDLVFLYGKPDPDYAPSGQDSSITNNDDKELSVDEDSIKTGEQDEMDLNAKPVENGENIDSKTQNRKSTYRVAQEEHDNNEMLEPESKNLKNPVGIKNELSIKSENYWDVIGNEAINKSLERYKTSHEQSNIETDDDGFRTQVNDNFATDVVNTSVIVKVENVESSSSTLETTPQAVNKKDHLQAWTDDDVGHCISIPDSYANVDTILEKFSDNVNDIQATSLLGENINLGNVSKICNKPRKKRKRKQLSQDLNVRKVISDSEDDIIELDLETDTETGDMNKKSNQENEGMGLDMVASSSANVSVLGYKSMEAEILSWDENSIESSPKPKIPVSKEMENSSVVQTNKIQHSKNFDNVKREKYKKVLETKTAILDRTVQASIKSNRSDATKRLKCITFKNSDFKPVVTKHMICEVGDTGFKHEKAKIEKDEKNIFYRMQQNDDKTKVLNLDDKYIPRRLESENDEKVEAPNKISLMEKWNNGENRSKLKNFSKTNIPEKLEKNSGMIKSNLEPVLGGGGTEKRMKIFDKGCQNAKTVNNESNFVKHSPSKFPHFSTARAWNINKLKKLKMMDRNPSRKIEKSPILNSSIKGNKMNLSKIVPKNTESNKSKYNSSCKNTVHNEAVSQSNPQELNITDDEPPQLEVMEPHITVDSEKSSELDEKLPTLSLDGVTFEDYGCQIKPCSVKVFRFDDDDIQFICDKMKAGYKTEYANCLFTMHKNDAKCYDQLVNGKMDISQKPWKRKRILQVCKDMFEMKKYFAENTYKLCSNKNRKKKHKLATKRRKFVEDTEWMLNLDSDLDTISFNSSSDESVITEDEESHFVCPDDDCNRKFLSSLALERHMVRVHDDENYSERKLCPVDDCERSYSNKYILMNHIKKDHGEDVYSKIREELYGTDPKATSPEPAVVRPAGTCLMPTVWRTPKLLMPPQVTASKPSPTQPPKNVKEVEDIKNILSDLTQSGNGTFYSILSNK